MSQSQHTAKLTGRQKEATILGKAVRVPTVQVPIGQVSPPLTFIGLAVQASAA